MEFKYKFKLQPSDLWQFHMYYAYSSYLCIINIICILSSIVLLIQLWDNSPLWFRGVMLLFFSLFTVIQPCSIYLRSRKQLKNNQDELELFFQEKGLTVTVNGKKEFKNWNQIQGIVLKPTLVAIYTDKNHGYILTNRILKDTKKQFRAFIQTKRGKRV